MRDEQFEKTALEAMAEHKGEIMTFGLDVVDAICVAGSIHLALRHPAHVGPSALRAERFAERIAEQIGGLDPALGEVCRRGRELRYDVQVVPQAGPPAVPVRGAFGSVAEDVDVRQLRDDLAGVVRWCRRNPDAKVSLQSRVITAIGGMLGIGPEEHAAPGTSADPPAVRPAATDKLRW